MFSKVLVANRGEIACRIMRTLKDMGIRAVGIYSEADVDAEHVMMADEAYCVGAAPARESYLNTAKILEIINSNNIEAVHPGYGFLSENVEFSKSCKDLGVEFIGPTEKHILDFGLKHRARVLAEQAGVSLIPGSGLLRDLDDALTEADKVGYPVMLKSTAGGGGIGMRICEDINELENAFETIKRLGKNNFNDDGIFLEKYIRVSRHIEVQIFGNGQGNIVVLGERDCSVQRRNQKVIEETPAPDISQKTREELHAAAKRIGEMIAYRSAGTVEFIYDTESEEFYFLEVNTRLQVEHGITEEVFGIDLVRWMIELSAGEDPTKNIGKLEPHGAAIEMRIYAEDPGKNYQPSSGVITSACFPENSRCDKWIETGTEVCAHYDPLLAKLIVKGEDRSEAIRNSVQALHSTKICGFETNLILLEQIMNNEAFICGKLYTRLLDTIEYSAKTVEVITPGTQTTVQDVPGRVGYWGIGVPPSGPMDSLHFKIANTLVGNNENAAALEMTLMGGSFKFNVDSVIAIAGAEVKILLNNEVIEAFKAVNVAKGDILSIGRFDKGQRVYFALRGGFDVPDYMASKSTFTLGRFGGHAGRALMAGDVLRIGSDIAESWQIKEYPASLRYNFSSHWKIGVMYGPHGAPDFFTVDDIKTLFKHKWEVHFNSSRTGVRLIGPKPKWARTDGGEAGLHPSNIHDNAYAIGAVDFTGDMPVILGPDGPSLGGFVCPITVVEAELWKVGQLKAGDTVEFIPVTLEKAIELNELGDSLKVFTGDVSEFSSSFFESDTPVIASWNSDDELEKIVCRQSGDNYILLEFGKLELDLRLRFKVHAWDLKFSELNISGILDITPGIRSIQIHFDSKIISRAELLDVIESLIQNLSENCPVEVDSRIVYLPLSWDDPQTKRAIQKYVSSVRKDAPWCPSNIEFIKRINGLDSIEDVKDILFDASYLVMGLGDVYLGAPVATPVDPRHRLVTTKYNPARTWTPENAVGIGGAYLCVYGMEGPGGYQFVGRTVQMWNRYHVTKEFEAGKPWLLRSFDQIKFYPVSGEELLEMRRDFVKGRFTLRIEDAKFNIEEYERFLADNNESITTFKEKQQAAFAKEYQYWVENNLLTFEEEVASLEKVECEIAQGTIPVAANVSGCIWKFNKDLGDTVEEGEDIIVLESMKTEIAVTAPCSGKISQIFCKSGDTINQGQSLCTVIPH